MLRQIALPRQDAQTEPFGVSREHALSAKLDASAAPARESHRVFIESVRHELAPAGLVQGLLADIVAQSAWRVAQGFASEAGLGDMAEQQFVRAIDVFERFRKRAATEWGASRPRLGGMNAGVARESDSAVVELAPVEPPYHVEGLGEDEVIGGGRYEADCVRSQAVPAASWSARLAFDAAICTTSPVIRGTRITARQIVSLVVDGQTWADILESNPALTEDDIRACLAYTVEQEDGPELA